MRLIVALSVFCFAAAAMAQDTAAQQMQIQNQIMVNQQMMTQATQAAQQAMQEQQQQAIRLAQQSQQAALSGTYCCSLVSKPRLSIKSGAYSSSVTLRMKDWTRHAVIYYTTDGWTPTRLSTRYVGPVTFSRTTHLQAVAITPDNQRSEIAFATYTFPVSAIPCAKTSTDHRQGVPVPLVFTAAVTSKGMQVGDKLPIVLAVNLVVDGTLLAPKGTPVFATVTQVDSPTWGGTPGDLTFAVHAILIGNRTIYLVGSETKESSVKNTVRHLQFIPFIGMVRGNDAEISKGAKLTAFLENHVSPSQGR